MPRVKNEDKLAINLSGFATKVEDLEIFTNSDGELCGKKDATTTTKTNVSILDTVPSLQSFATILGGEGKAVRFMLGAVNARIRANRKTEVADSLGGPEKAIAAARDEMSKRGIPAEKIESVLELMRATLL